MSLQDDKTKFLDFAEDCGNPYYAVNQINSWVRDILRKYDHHLLASEVISWVVRGHRPLSIDKNTDELERHVKKIQKSNLEELLCYVDDEEVCNSVRMSYDCSIQNKELSFIYGDVLDEPRRARIRILMRILWCT